MGVHWKTWLLGGWCSWKTNIEGGGFPKKGAWTVCQFKGAWQERAGSVFEGGLIPPMHTMSEWLQAKCFKVSHSFDFWLSARRRQRFAGEHFAKKDDQKIECDFIAFSEVIKLIPTWCHEIF